MGTTLRRASRLIGALALATPLALVTAPAHAADSCAGKPATIIGTTGVDRLVGTPGADVIVGLDGDDVIDGRGGDDLVCGDDGSDVLRGGAGRDQLYGGLGGIVLDRFGRPMVTGDVLYGGPGDDLFDGGVDDRARRPSPTRCATALPLSEIPASWLATSCARKAARASSRSHTTVGICTPKCTIRKIRATTTGSLESWNVRESPARARCHRGSLSIRRPASQTSPPSPRTEPAIRPPTVDLPAPFGPTRPRIWPAYNSSDTSSTATLPP